MTIVRTRRTVQQRLHNDREWQKLDLLLIAACAVLMPVLAVEPHDPTLLAGADFLVPTVRSQIGSFWDPSAT